MEIRVHSDDEWSELIAHLRGLPRFLYYHNMGNAGDQLIYLGMCELFKRHGIEFDEFSEERFQTNKHVVYGAGGNFVGYYDNCSNFIETYFDLFDSFTLLPHTVSGHELLLSRLDDRFSLFCREPVSEAHCRKFIGETGHVFLTHDLAFCIEPHQWKRLRMPGVKFKKDLRWIREQWQLRRKLRGSDVTLFRTDLESARAEPGEGNYDLSMLIQAPLERRKYRELRVHPWRLAVANAFFSHVSHLRRVETDRLHVSISGALSGRPTQLYGGSYYKNYAIFEHSMRDYYPNVEFVGPRR
jgi:exopolysaccharide biosynthesis predicted pyruvyltransferase EpsI